MKMLISIALVLALILTGCSPLNAEQRDAVRAFEDLLAVLPAEGDGRDDTGAWRITAPDGSAWFEWYNQGVLMGVDTRPFISSGPDSTLGVDTPLIFFAPGFNMLNLDVQPTAIKQFEKDAAYIRERIGYAFSTDRYYIDIDGLGNRIEFARDTATNDKDIVFMINAQPLIEKGADSNKVEGWSYELILSGDADGNPTEVWKFVKVLNVA